MGLPVRIWSMPVEIASPIRFEEDRIGHIARLIIEYFDGVGF